MSQTQAPAQPVQQPPQTVPNMPPPAVIATRRRCDAEGVGLSHYILMDRKVGQ